MVRVTPGPSVSAPGSEKTTARPEPGQPRARTVATVPDALARVRASVSVRYRHATGESSPVGPGDAPTEEPPIASATKVVPGLAGQAHAPPEQTSPPAEQSTPGCQVRQADPLATGRQTWIGPLPAPHRDASSCVQASVVGHAHAALPPPSWQAVPGSPQAVEEASYQQPDPVPSWAQETTCPPGPQKLAVLALQRVVEHRQDADPLAGEHSW